MRRAGVLELVHPGTGAASLAAPAAETALLETRGLTVATADRTLLRGVSLRIEAGTVLGIIGPSGAGKTTFLRSLNRLIDLSPSLRVSGEVNFKGRSIRDREVDPNELRARIGMIFQQPVVFPGSVFDNVIFGVRHGGKVARRQWRERGEAALREAALWNEVCHRLAEPARSLSVGQQQRLCLARALACDPEVLLLDEPTSALDPRSTEAIEELVRRLRGPKTIVLVTHNVGQAGRVADDLLCLCVRDGAGEIAERGCCTDLLDRPQSEELLEFLSGGRS
jgi:phosphate transport system ATP-binding protein